MEGVCDFPFDSFFFFFFFCEKYASTCSLFFANNRPLFASFRFNFFDRICDPLS